MNEKILVFADNYFTVKMWFIGISKKTKLPSTTFLYAGEDPDKLLALGKGTKYILLKGHESNPVWTNTLFQHRRRLYEYEELTEEDLLESIEAPDVRREEVKRASPYLKVMRISNNNSFEKPKGIQLLWSNNCIQVVYLSEYAKKEEVIHALERLIRIISRDTKLD